MGRPSPLGERVLVPDATAETWVLPCGDVTAHGGATVACSRSMQSSDVATVLVLGGEAVVEHYGYKRRSSRVVAYVDGAEQDIPAPVLLAMGLLKPASEPAVIAPPPALEGAMASAFAALRR